MQNDVFQPGEGVHFVGIGGAGMFPMAAVLAQKGCVMSGSDLIENKNTQVLEEIYGVHVSYGEHRAFNVPKTKNLKYLVHTSAAKSDNPEILEAQKLGLKIYRRGDALAELTRHYERVVAISGSHGKTTITAMLAHILRKLCPAAGFIVGGKVNTWKIPSNAGNGDIFVTEADESDGSHTALSPYLTVIPNIEDDHAWSVGGDAQLMANFRQLVSQSKHVIYIHSANTDTACAGHAHAQGYTKEALSSPEFFKTSVFAEIQDWPDFQIQNAALALLVLDLLGFDRKDSEPLLPSFPGAARRMVKHVTRLNAVLIEDYAHHPTELAAFLSGLRKMYPGWRVQVIFQPHRYARLKRYIHEFADLLKTVDQVVVTPVFAAWVNKEGVDSADLARLIGPTASVFEANDWEKIAHAVDPFYPHPVGVVTAVVGAGDIEKVLPYLKGMY